MYVEASDSNSTEVATKQQQPTKDVEASSTKEVAEVDSSQKESDTQQETTDSTERSEVERLRKEFSELRDEVDALKRQLEDDIPVSFRGVGLRIVKDRIQSILDEGEIGSLRSRMAKVQEALEIERQRCFELEQQLDRQVKEEDELAITKANLIYCEKQVEEWKTKHGELESALQKTTLQLNSQLAENQSVALSLSKANAMIQQLQSEKQESDREAASKRASLEEDLEAEHRAKEVAWEKIQHLEKLVLKLTEESNAASDSNGISNGNSMEPAPPSESSYSKTTTSLPDPPSEEISSKGDERGDAEQEKDMTNDETSAKENLTELKDAITADATLKPEESMSEELSMRHQERGWKWNVSGLWGYVTGEPNQ